MSETGEASWRAFVDRVQEGEQIPFADHWRAFFVSRVTGA
jgi:hypothetical protein